jgi:hypothetical protein
MFIDDTAEKRNTVHDKWRSGMLKVKREWLLRLIPGVGRGPWVRWWGAFHQEVFEAKLCSYVEALKPSIQFGARTSEELIKLKKGQKGEVCSNLSNCCSLFL